MGVLATEIYGTLTTMYGYFTEYNAVTAGTLGVVCSDGTVIADVALGSCSFGIRVCICEKAGWTPHPYLRRTR